MQSSPPSPPKRNGLKVALIVVGVAVASLALLYLFVAGRQVEAEPGDRERVVTVQDLDELFELELDIDPAGETLTRQKYFDGSYDIDYEYAAPDESLYLSVSISNENNKQDARAVYTGATVSMELAFKALGDGVEPHDVPGMITQGDKSEAGWLTYGAERIGVYAVVLDDERVLTFFLSGLTMEAEDVRLLLAPCLERL